VKILFQTSEMTLTRVCWIFFGHKKQEYFMFLTVKCKENGSGTNLMEDLACKVKIPSQTSGITLTRVCWMICGHKKQQYFVFFTEKCKKNKAETNLMEGLACKVQTLSQMSGTALT
jgi:hypothetical protein